MVKLTEFMTGGEKESKKPKIDLPFIYFSPARGKSENNNKGFMEDA